jgi:hypothetical protein
MKKHTSIYVFIAILVMGFTGSALAKKCPADMKRDTCSHQNGKGKKDCENAWQTEGPTTFYHCKWIPGVTKSTGICIQSENKCTTN